MVGHRTENNPSPNHSLFSSWLLQILKACQGISRNHVDLAVMSGSAIVLLNIDYKKSTEIRYLLSSLHNSNIAAITIDYEFFDADFISLLPLSIINWLIKISIQADKPLVSVFPILWYLAQRQWDLPMIDWLIQWINEWQTFFALWLDDTQGSTLISSSTWQ